MSLDPYIMEAPPEGLLIELLACEVPPEYREAEVPEAIRASLKRWAPTVLLQGPPGCGKTRIAWGAYRSARLRQWAAMFPVDGRRYSWRKPVDAVEQVLMEAPPRFKITNESELAREATSDTRWDAVDALTDWPGVLVVDDLGYATPTRWTVEAIYHLANQRRAFNRATWWTTNRTPDEVCTLYSPAVWSRINGGESYNLRGQDRRQA